MYCFGILAGATLEVGRYGPHYPIHGKLGVQMDIEQKKLLTKRLQEAIEKQPEIKRLSALLLRLGGEFLVAPSNPDQDIPLLLEDGFVTSGTIKLKPMKSSSCHQNVASLWKKKQLGIVAISTGYGLSEDGLWRQHSWGIWREGILETTRTRTKYFGIILQGKHADFFAANNL